MAIYRCELKTFSRSRGQSAVASAAYRSGERLLDEREGKEHDYTNRKGVLDKGIITSEIWAADRATLWNTAERTDTRKNSVTARELVLSLPCELTFEQNRETVLDFCKWIADRYKVAVDYAIHAPHREGDQRNIHAHVMFTTRRLTKDGLGDKTRELDDRASGEVDTIREHWEQYANKSLAAAEVEHRVDRRSLKERGIERIPEPKLGAAKRMAERGEHPDRKRQWDAIRHRNAVRDQLAVLARQSFQKTATFIASQVLRLARDFTPSRKQDLSLGQ